MLDPPTTTVTVTGQNFINGAQVLMNGSPVATTFNSGTQLTATLNPTEPGNLDLQGVESKPRPGDFGGSDRAGKRHTAGADRHSSGCLAIS